MQSFFLGPVGKAHNFTLKLYLKGAARVAHLVVLGNPPHVHRPTVFGAFLTLATGVMPIVVDSVDGVSPFRHFSNILKKTNERTHPSLAHLYSSPAPVFKTGGVWVRAPLDNSFPLSVFKALRHPVRTALKAGIFSAQTAARFSISNFHPSRLHGDKPPAIAKAVTLGFIGLGALQRHADHGQTSKPLADYVVNAVESLALKWKAFGRFFHNAYMTEFSERRLMTGAAFAFSLCQKPVTMQ